VVKKEASAPASLTDGTKVYEASGTSYNDLNLDNTKEYFYALFAVDSSSNYSTAVTISARPIAGATQANDTGGAGANTGGTGNQGTGTGTGSSGLPSVTGPFSVGIRSEQVKILQQVLATDPTIYPEGLVTGFYGPATTEAVKRFQARHMSITSGTPSTNGYGLAGQTTRAKINEVFALSGGGQLGDTSGGGGTTGGTTTGGTGTATGQTVKGPFSVGMRSEQVKVLQQILARDSAIYPEGTVTGLYDSATVAAVKRFQAQHMGITSGTPSTNGYGLAGPKTRAKINEVLGGVTGQTSTRTPEQTAALIEDLKRQIAELTKLIADLIAARQAGTN
jgi:peptidoglycan hydrolase-like protein with peptidoglycan-binding domain